MDLRALELFVAIAEEGSIHAGARRFRVTQPAASQTLQKLEREVGGGLMVRTPQGVRLTPAGVALLEQARDLLRRMESTTDSVREIARTDNCALRVGLMSGTASAGDLTLPIVNAFRIKYPQVRLSVLDLSFAEQFESIVDGHVDVAIVRPPCEDDRLDVVELFYEPVVLCFSAGHRLAEAESVQLDDMLDEPMIELVRTARPWREHWELNQLRGGPPRHIYPEPAVTLSELQYSLLCEPVVVAASASGWHYGLSSPLLRAVPILDAAPSQVAVAYRRTPARAWAREFAACAREVSEQMYHLVPGGRLTPN